MEGADQASPNWANGPTDYKEVGDGATKEGQGLSQEEESRVHGIAEGDLRCKGNVTLTEEDGSLKQQQPPPPPPPPGPVVLWERFLPVRTLQVLLVENDYSTRQVVSALLRNCSYEVTSVPNGVQAWKILEELTNHIDLVLTEVVMPWLSGISLLEKIINHKTHKNIPVVMMSSNDSMGTVFKCLSKGAVDFLVKPIRKNELKNLWQHVWRRCHSSSGSGSESSIQAQKSVMSKSANYSANDSVSNDDDDENISSGLNTKDGSDNGSGTQSSWTKRAVELESPQRNQSSDPPDSTCAQAIHPKPETLYEDLTLMNVNKEIQRQKELADDLMGKYLEIGVSKDQEFLRLKNKDASDKPSIQAVNLLGSIGNSPDITLTTRDTQASNRFIKVPEGLDKTNDSNIDASLELSLKRLRSIADGGTTSHEDRNILRRSEQSAFTRYHTSVASNQAATGCGGSCVPFDNSSEGVKAESTYNKISSSNAAPLKQDSNGSNINDVCSPAKNFPSPKSYKDDTSISAGKRIDPTTPFHHVEFRASQQNVQEKAEGRTTDIMIGKSRGVQPQVQVEHHHHHYHHHHHHIHNVQEQQHQQPPQPGQDSFSLKGKTVAADCGLSDKLVPLEGNAVNYSVIGSNSGSNHGSNGNNGRSTAVKVGGLNMDSVNGTNDHVGPEGGNGSGSVNGMEQQQSSRREEALKKFRQKRKERNFEKKVRYHSRKRLAEQRPRVRGQFVRHIVQEQTDQEAER